MQARSAPAWLSTLPVDMGTANTEPNQVSRMSPLKLKLLIKTSAGPQMGSLQN